MNSTTVSTLLRRKYVQWLENASITVVSQITDLNISMFVVLYCSSSRHKLQNSVQEGFVCDTSEHVRVLTSRSFKVKLFTMQYLRRVNYPLSDLTLQVPIYSYSDRKFTARGSRDFSTMLSILQFLKRLGVLFFEVHSSRLVFRKTIELYHIHR